MIKVKNLSLNKVTIQNLSQLSTQELEKVKGQKSPKTIELTICFITPNSCLSCPPIC